MKKSTLSELALFLVAIFWGGGFVAVKDALDAISPFYMIAIRFFGAAAILALIFQRRLRCTRKHEIKGGVIIGILLFISFAFQTVGLQYTLPGKQAFLTGIYVIMVPFLYWLIKKQRPDNYSIAAAFLTLLGIGLITLHEGFRLNSGDWLTLLCDVFFALQIIAVDRYAKNCDTIILAIIQMFTSAALAFIFALIFEPFPGMIKINGLFSLGYLVIFSTMLAFLVQNVAQKYTAPTPAAIIMSLESVFGAIFSIIFLGEEFTLSKIIGCVIIFFAIILSETKLSFITKPKTTSLSGYHENNVGGD